MARTRRTREPSARPGNGNGTTDLCPRSISLSASRADRSSTRPRRGHRGLPVRAKGVLIPGQDDDPRKPNSALRQVARGPALERQGDHRLHRRRRSRNLQEHSITSWCGATHVRDVHRASASPHRARRPRPPGRGGIEHASRPAREVRPPPLQEGHRGRRRPRRSVIFHRGSDFAF